MQKKVKTDYPETAFVIVSGYADFSYAREALQFHASDYLLKPVDVRLRQKDRTDYKVQFYAEYVCNSDPV